MWLDDWNRKRIVDLSQPIRHMQPVNNPNSNLKPAFWDRKTHAETKGTYQHAPDHSWHLRDFMIGEHTSTHVDAFCHFTPGEDALCLEKMSLSTFIAPAVCVDLSHKRSVEWITPADLQAALDAQGLTIRAGDILLYHVNFYERSPEPPYPTDWTGLDWNATMWLADQGVVNIGCEAPSIDHWQATRLDSDPCFPAHRACRERQITNTENLADLRPVVGQRFLFIGLPLKLHGGTGCPIRAIALLED
jgi:kynurenine formamidase